MSELAFSSATRIAQLVRQRELSALQVVEHYLERIQQHNARLNAVVYHDAELARGQARQIDRRIAAGEDVGPLGGVPFTVKDMYEVAGMPSTSGTLGRKSFRPQRDATVVERLRRAGGIVLGKTNVPEFGLALESVNLVYGTTNNPYDLQRTPGGSSGGAAAALAAGLCALEIGSDGGGSIRVPAHFCGVAGFKPTHGRVSKAGHFPVHSGIGGPLAGYGPLARSAADLALAFQVLQGEDPHDPDAVPRFEDPEVALRGLRVAYHTDNGIRSPTPEIAAAVERCAKALEQAGAIVSADRMPVLEEAYELHLGLLIVDRGFVDLWMEAAGTSAEQLHPWVTGGREYAADAGADFDAHTASLLSDDWYLFKLQAARFMESYDLLLSPIAPVPALPHEESSRASNFDLFSYASVYNLSGFPAATVRCGTSPEGLPIGVQVAGRRFRDRLVLDALALLERECGGFAPPSSFSA